MHSQTANGALFDRFCPAKHTEARVARESAPTAAILQGQGLPVVGNGIAIGRSC